MPQIDSSLCFCRTHQQANLEGTIPALAEAERHFSQDRYAWWQVRHADGGKFAFTVVQIRKFFGAFLPANWVAWHYIRPNQFPQAKPKQAARNSHPMI